MASGVHYRPPDGLWARAANLLVAGWLIVSGFAWERGSPRIDSAVVGYLVFVFSMIATVVDDVRVLNLGLGGWLVVTAWVWPAKSLAMRCVETLSGVAVILLSMVSNRGSFQPPSLRRFFARFEGTRGAREAH